jgi:hypothetical protein
VTMGHSNIMGVHRMTWQSSLTLLLPREYLPLSFVTRMCLISPLDLHVHTMIRDAAHLATVIGFFGGRQLLDTTAQSGDRFSTGGDKVGSHRVTQDLLERDGVRSGLGGRHTKEECAIQVALLQPHHCIITCNGTVVIAAQQGHDQQHDLSIYILSIYIEDFADGRRLKPRQVRALPSGNHEMRQPERQD